MRFFELFENKKVLSREQEAALYSYRGNKHQLYDIYKKYVLDELGNHQD